MPILRSGSMQKMRTQVSSEQQPHTIEYFLELDDDPLLMNELMGREIYLKNLDEVNCLRSVTGASKDHSSGVIYK